jgi:Plavaka transposase
VYIWLGNLSSGIRAARGKGGAVLVGYLPKVPDHGLSETKRAALRNMVYHNCYKNLSSSIETSATEGDVFLFGDGRMRHCTTIPAVLPNDYPEL